MQILAMLTMLIDHIGIVFFPEQVGWRLIGRLAFPLYAYGIVMGYQYTSDVRRYLLRLVILAVLSQFPFMWSMNTNDLNVIATLTICLAVLILWDRAPQWSLRIAFLLGAVFLLEALPFDYGYYGLILVLIYRYTKGYVTVLLHFALNTWLLAEADGAVQFASLFSTVCIVYGRKLFLVADRVRVPRWVWRSFYPVHLTVIAVIHDVFLVTP